MLRSGICTGLIIALCAMDGSRVVAQSLSVSGFVKADNIYDSRQVEQIREGHFNLYPLPRLDANADDRDDNATDNLLLTAIQSRLCATGRDTTLLGVDLTGTIEIDFFGTSNENVNVIRLRHAYIRLSWPRHELLFGQYWSPLFSVPVFPQVINFSTGAPFQPFARYPQVMYTYKPGVLRIMGAVTQQRDAFQEIGGRKMQQQAGLPAAHVHIQAWTSALMLGVGGTVKSVRPELTGRRFSAGAVQGYGLLRQPWGEIRAKLTYGRDLADHLMTGGFLALDDGGYSCLGVLGSWMDYSTATRPWSAGLFVGYMTNLGSTMDTKDTAVISVYARATNLKRAWRISPRVSYGLGALRFALELEATSATYCSALSDSFEPMVMDLDKAVVNFRTLVAIYFAF